MHRVYIHHGYKLARHKVYKGKSMGATHHLLLHNLSLFQSKIIFTMHWSAVGVSSKRVDGSDLPWLIRARAMSKHRPCISLIQIGKSTTKISRGFASLHLPTSHPHPYWSIGFPKAILKPTKADFCVTELAETLTVWSVYRIDSKVN